MMFDDPRAPVLVAGHLLRHRVGCEVDVPGGRRGIVGVGALQQDSDSQIRIALQPNEFGVSTCLYPPAGESCPELELTVEQARRDVDAHLVDDADRVVWPPDRSRSRRFAGPLDEAEDEPGRRLEYEQRAPVVADGCAEFDRLGGRCPGFVDMEIEVHTARAGAETLDAEVRIPAERLEGCELAVLATWR